MKEKCYLMMGETNTQTGKTDRPQPSTWHICRVFRLDVVDNPAIKFNSLPSPLPSTCLIASTISLIKLYGKAKLVNRIGRS